MSSQTVILARVGLLTYSHMPRTRAAAVQLQPGVDGVDGLAEL